MVCTLTLSVSFSQNPEEEKSIQTDTLSEVVLTSTLYPEKITKTPVSIQVLKSKDINRFAGSNVWELASSIQGVEFTRYGVDGITFNARGLNSAFNNKILHIVDGRITTAALSGGLPTFNNGTLSKDDIHHIEFVAGPQTALYGPNAHNGIFNTITKDPRLYPGTSVSLSFGNQEQFSGRFRHGKKINDSWAWKISGEYVSGREFIFYDSVYVGMPQKAIPEHNVNFDFNHVRGEAHLYYNVNPKSSLILSGGSSKNDFLQVVTSGRNQINGLTYSFLQLKYTSPHFYGNVYNTWGDLGDSYAISAYTRTFWTRTQPGENYLPPDEAEQVAFNSARFKEKSKRFNADFQYRNDFPKLGLFLVAGFDYENSQPNLEDGNTLVGNSGDISVSQIGAVLQLEKKLFTNYRLISAFRFDKNDNFDNQFAPKFMFVKDFQNGNVRLGWAKAYALPSIQNQYANIQSFFFGNGGEGVKYIPNGSMINDPASVRSTQSLKPEEVNTWELGFKTQATSKLWMDINAYYGISKNFITPALPVEGRAISVNDIPVIQNPAFAGIDNNGMLQNASFFTFFNYGKAKIYGMDAGFNWDFSSTFNLAFNYSYLNGEFEENDANNDGVISEDEKSLNAPKNRANIILSIKDLCKERLAFYLGARFVEKYDFYSGNQVGSEEGEGTRVPPKNFNFGPLGGFTTFNFGSDFQLSEKVTINFNVSNLFNTNQIEFVGSPSIDRLAMASIKISD